MLRQTISAKFPKLFDDEDDAEKRKEWASSLRENANNPTGEIVAQFAKGADTGSLDFVSPGNSSPRRWAQLLTKR